MASYIAIHLNIQFIIYLLVSYKATWINHNKRYLATWLNAPVFISYLNVNNWQYNYSIMTTSYLILCEKMFIPITLKSIVTVCLSRYISMVTIQGAVFNGK